MQQPSAMPTMVTNLTNAINGEFNAIHFYEALAKLAPTEAIRKRILEIRRDEMRHFQSFVYAFMQLTGRSPSPEVTETMPSSYKAGIRAAFFDEQEAVEFYHRAARGATIPYVSQLFTSASMDEQNHAVWFLFFLQET